MVTRAAEMANADKFVTEMKDGYDTETGEKGLQLSGKIMIKNKIKVISLSSIKLVCESMLTLLIY